MTYKSELELNEWMSQYVSKRIKALAKQCYHNAYLAMQGLPDATYVEGVILLSLPIAVDHAWLEREGKIIDPTMCGKPIPFAKQDRINGKSKTDGDLARAYFPVLRYTYDEMLERLLITERAGFLPMLHDKTLFTDAERTLYRAVHDEAFLYDMTPEQREQLQASLKTMNAKLKGNTNG